MNKFILLALTTLMFGISAMAQQASISDIRQKVETKNMDTLAWMYSGDANLGFNEGMLHNWGAGGELASLTVNSRVNATLIRYKHYAIWTTNLDLAYGLFYAQSYNFVPRKTDDRIDLTSKFGHRLSKSGNVYLTGLFNAKTQFTKGYDYNLKNWDTFSTSNCLSPLYLTFAPGLEYRRGTRFSLFFSPAAFKTTFVSQYYTNKRPEGAFGVAHGNTVRFEFGAYLTARYVKDLHKNITFRSRLDLYCNYLAKDVYNNGLLIRKDNPGNIDIMLDNAITFRFFKYFSVNFGITAIYDNDVPFIEALAKHEPKAMKDLGWWQIKQTLNFGFNYKF
jgi:hypothetical protein